MVSAARSDLTLSCAASVMALALCPVAVASTAPTMPPACKDFLQRKRMAGDSRDIRVDDLLRLRDIGYSYVPKGARIFSLSPDGRKLAFTMHRADPASNRYCFALMALDLDRPTEPVLLDAGDEVMVEAFSIRGIKVDYGSIRNEAPVWSADGSSLLYLKQTDGRAQLWKAGLDGEAAQLTHSQVGVDRFRLSHGGRAIIFSDRPGISAQEQAIAQEGEQGFLLDDRIAPYSSSRPAVRLPQPERVQLLDLGSRNIAPASPTDLEEFGAPLNADPNENMLSARATDGAIASVVRTTPASYASPTFVTAVDAKGRKSVCPADACKTSLLSGFEGIWWTGRKDEIAFLRREGWGGSKLGIYSWTVGRSQTQKIYETADLLMGCEMDAGALICAQEGSQRPRAIVRIPVRPQPQETLLYDPNPQFSALRLGKVERLEWRNENRSESFADLVLPYGHKPGDKPLPLVIVQYMTRGLLRGGTGDEYPIQLLARAGMAVLSLQRPPAITASDGNGKSTAEILKSLSDDWADRRNIHSSLMQALKIVTDRGDIDASRIGISGVSDGATTAQFAMIHAPRLFRAASMGSCCLDPTSMMIYGGPGLTEEREKWGFPPAQGPGSGAWQAVSLAVNPSDVMAPLLMNLADHEFLISQETYAAYRRAHRPVDVRIFPDEFHLKWQPAHRRAIYCRNVAWFSFWLDVNAADIGCEPDATELARWAGMRKAAPG